MRKFIGMAAAVVLAGATAQAGVTGNFRTIYSSETEEVGSAETKSGRFSVDHAWVNLTGTAGEGVSYQARFDMMADDGLDHAFVSRKFSDALTLRAGKLFTTQASWENYYETYQVYNYSTLNNWILGNETGLGLDYMMGDHKITVEAFNTNENAASAQSKTMTTVSYSGKVGPAAIIATHTTGTGQGFLNGVVLAGLEFGTSVDPDATDVNFAADSTYSLTSVGAQLSMVPGWLIDVEYGMGKVEKGEQPLAAANMELEETGFVLNAGMTEGMYRGQVKYWMTEITANTGTEATVDSTGLGLVLEVVPGGDDFRYFVGYNMNELKPKTGTSTKTNTMFAGLTLNTDFLK